jgi:hypothetical protein
MPLLNTQKLLKKIKAGDPETIYRNVCEKVAEWAICGYMDEANHLLDVLWKFNNKDYDKDPRYNEGFQVMWEVSGIAPKTEIPFSFIEMDDIEKKNLNYFLKAYGQPALKDLYKPLLQSSVDELFVKSVFFYHKKLAPADEILSSLKKFLQESKYATDYTHFQASTSGCLLAVHHGTEEILTEFMAIWASGYMKFRDSYFPSYLMSDRLLARDLLLGRFSGKLGFIKSDCYSETVLLEEALKERSEKGRTLIYGNMTWKELLKRISELSIQRQEHNFSSGVIDKKWLGFEPATVSEIRKKEAELGVRFPPDYIDFLLTSNGFMSCRNTCPSLCSINQVGFLRNTMPIIIEGCEMTIDDEVLLNSFRNGILISGIHDEEQLILGPVEHGQWVCWLYTVWIPGERQFQSIRYFMEYELQLLEEE